MATDTSEQLIDANPELQSYYHSLESRIGYDVILGGARHFGYWEKDTYWPFPLGRALRAMEDKLGAALSLKPGARLLDAGCGVGNLAIHLAQSHGHRVLAIDVVDYHLDIARQNMARASLPPSQVEFAKMDYHHLDGLPSGTFDGAYTLETLVHATDLSAVLRGFHRLLRPGGRVAFFEYDHDFVRDQEAVAAPAANSAAPAKRTRPKALKEMLQDAGFTDVVVRDYTDNIRPMTRLFFFIAYIPWLIVSILGLERHFTNTVAVVDSYRSQELHRYLAISATKME